MVLQKCSTIKNVPQPRSRKDPQSKIKQRFVDKGPKNVLQSSNLCIKEFLDQEIFYKKVSQSNNVYLKNFLNQGTFTRL